MSISQEVQHRNSRSSEKKEEKNTRGEIIKEITTTTKKNPKLKDLTIQLERVPIKRATPNEAMSEISIK